MAEYKLTYFNIRGRGESLRLLFALGKVKYEESQITFDEWPALKSKTPWDQLPYLQVGNDTIIGQTTTIGRYLARTFNLAGSTELENAKCDELVDAANDLLNEQIKHMLEQDKIKASELRKHLVEISIPTYFTKFDKIQVKNGGHFMIGQNVTWADLWIANLVDRLDERFSKDIEWNLYPNLKKMKDGFFAIPQIKNYIDKRPASEM